MPMTAGQGAHGRRIREQQNEGKRADFSSRNQLRGQIIQVYDKAWLDENETPIELRSRLARAPGALWAKVRLTKSGQEFILRFNYTDPQILSYNAESLRGMYVVIEYMGLSVENGTISLAGKEDKPLDNLNKSSVVADIGDIF